MANPTQDRPQQKRARGSNILAVISAAAAGRQLVGVTTRPGGITEYKFAPAGEPATAIDEPK
jgi:hypothetical protein